MPKRIFKPFEDEKPEAKENCCGNRMEPQYAERYDENGKAYLEKVGEVDTYEKIQSYRDECDIMAILSRYAAGDETAHTATMQAMYDYGNNTSQFLNNAMQTINSAKSTNNYTVANYMEGIMQEVTQTSAQGVQRMAQTINNNFNNKGWEHSKTDTNQTEKGVSGNIEGSYKSKS